MLRLQRSLLTDQEILYERVGRQNERPVASECSGFGGKDRSSTSIKRTDRGFPTERRRRPPGNRTRLRMTRRGWGEERDGWKGEEKGEEERWSDKVMKKRTLRLPL